MPKHDEELEELTKAFTELQAVNPVAVASGFEGC